jgi:nitroreductase
MELRNALRTTGAVRDFTDEPVSDGTLYALLDTARFAPSGGNRQAWRAIVVKDPELRLALRDLYLPGWNDYLAIAGAGLVPWAPVTDRDAEAAALENADPDPGHRGDFADNLHRVPALVVVLADLRALAAVDRDFERYPMAGGASIYPFVWSVLLAARDHGLAGVITTMLVRREPQVRELLGIPDSHAVAAVLALGHPVRQPTRLRRAPVEQFTAINRYGGPALEG